MKRKYALTIIGILLGGIAGYCYYYFIGCNSGNCSITSKPVNSTLYGAVMGGLILNLFKKPPEEKTTDKQSIS